MDNDASPPKPQPRNVSQTTKQMDQPPPYKSHLPPTTEPAISGYLEKCLDPTKSVQSQTWQRVYVEVSVGELRCFPSRDKVDRSSDEYVVLVQSYAFVHARRYIRIEMIKQPTVHLFRAASETRAYHWAFVMTQYAQSKPFSEGFCLKMSGGKKILEERYLKVGQDGLLSWYKTEKADDASLGTLQLGGRNVHISPEDDCEMRVVTSDRTYVFKFSDKDTATQWYNISHWHSLRKPLNNPAKSVRRHTLPSK